VGGGTKRFYNARSAGWLCVAAISAVASAAGIGLLK